MNKVVLLGFDGLSWNLINQMISEGKLKEIQYIINNGVSGNLKADKPLISPKIWTSMFTGKTEEHHGIIDFYSSENDLKSKQIWDIISDQGGTVGIYRPLSVWKVQEIDDFFIPGFFSINQKAYPQKYSVISELDQTAREEKKLSISRSKMIKSFWKFLKLGFPLSKLIKLMVKSFKLILTKDKYKKLELIKSVEFLIHTTFFRYLLKKYEPDFSLLYENSCDSLSHKFWSHIDTKSEFRNTIRDIYERIDSYIGNIMNFCKKKGYGLFLISDHGFKSIGDHLRPEGCISLDVEKFLRRLELEKDVYGVSLAVEYIFRIKTNSSVNYDELVKKFKSIKSNQDSLFDIERLEDKIILRFQDVKNLFRLNELKIRDEEYNIFHLDDIVEFNSDNTGTHSKKDGVFLAIGPNIKKGTRISDVKPIHILPTVLLLMNYKLPKDLEGSAISEVFIKEPEMRFYEEKSSEIPNKGELSSKEEDIVKKRLRSLGYL